MFMAAVFIIVKTRSNQDVLQKVTRETVVHPYSGVLFNDKRKQAIEL